jgi:DNA processing protein
VALLLADKQIWTALMSVEGIGNSTFGRVQQALKHLHVSWGEFWFSGSQSLWSECKLHEQQQQALLDFQARFSPESYYGWLRDKNITVLAYSERKYPELLKKIDKRPTILFTKSEKEKWNSTPIGVVGTRKISAYGRVATSKIVSELVAEHATIVSGFMYGVDAQAHRTALEHGGYTVGVLGFGFDCMFPPEHTLFFEEILAKGGSFITEYPPYVAPNKGTFVARNRIVAGMTLGTVVVEAGLKSGSHITVEFALGYGRSVFAVPGPITNPYSEGTKWLIKQGATLVSSGDEILEELTGKSMQPRNKAAPVFSEPFQQRLFSELQYSSQTSDGLAERLNESIVRVQSALSEMELEGYVCKTGASWNIR